MFNYRYARARRSAFVNCFKLGVVFLLLCTFIGCSTKQYITGEPVLYGVNNYTGAIIDRDLFPKPASNSMNADASSVKGFPIGVIPHKDEIISLVVDSVFIKYLKEMALASPQVLVWTEVYDDGSDDPQKAFTKVLFNGKNQPQGVYLGLANRVIYGPTPYKGHPLRVKFFIVELDKEEKETGAAIIETVGNVAAASSPQYAPAISLAIQFAQSLNALNEDDYELRFDVTLLPIGPSAVATTGDPVLSKHVTKVKDKDGNEIDVELPAEPAQREGKPFAISTPLRTGSYLILKRELEQRKVTTYLWDLKKESVKSKQLDIASSVDRDFTQEWFADRIKTTKGDEEILDYVLRAQGGYMWMIFRKDIDDPVVFQRGPDRGLPYSVVRGIRRFFRDMTHMMFTVVSGLPVKVDETVLAASSERDRERINALLDAGPEETVHSRLVEKVQDIEASLLTTVSKRQMSEYAARRTMRDPTFRSSPDYVLFWISRIDEGDHSADQRAQMAADTLNASILDTLTNLIINLPYMDAGDRTAMTHLKNLTAADFETPDENSHGVFKLNTQGLGKL